MKHIVINGITYPCNGVPVRIQINEEKTVVVLGKLQVEVEHTNEPLVIDLDQGAAPS